MNQYFMEMLLFYAPDFTVKNPDLPDDEAHHALKVLRLGVGDALQITNGKGNLHTAKIVSVEKAKPRLQVTATQTGFGKRDHHIHIAVAPTKNTDRTEWLVEKCVEMGVDAISFIQCDHSERKHFKTDRLEKIAISAMKQSLKAYLPVVSEMVPFGKFVSRFSNEPSTQLFIAHLGEGEKQYLSKTANPGGGCCVLIGPEGDFSPQEIRLAVASGFRAVSLGDSRLRTETAAMAACHTLNMLNLP